MSRSPLSTTFLLALLTLLLVVSPAVAKKKKKGFSTEPGTYIADTASEWHEDIDRVEILETFELPPGTTIRIGSLDGSGVEIPEDNTREPVLEVLEDLEGPFAEGLDKELSGVEVTREGGSDGLLVEGVVEELNPGSRAARYWGGFGAGAAAARLRVEVKDAASGEVLLRLTQERRSGFGVAGGNYVKLMQRSLREVGEDLAFVLSAFQ